jgi:SAM-dependent methyltransferase
VRQNRRLRRFDAAGILDVVDEVRELGSLLRRTGFDAQGLRGLFGELDRREIRMLREVGALESDGALGVLADLFYLGLRVDERSASEALAPVSPGELVEAGLLERSGDGFSSPLRISPWLGLSLAHDVWEVGRVDPGHVLGGNRSAETLARTTIRRHVTSTLDLGAGGGSQALLAARHSDRVVAVDVNPRALLYAGINARLNGVENIECRQGDLFGPVECERFDLILANLPYVVSPDDDLLFRDGGGDEGGVSRRAVRRLPEFLEEGGIAHVLCNWAVGPSEKRWEPIGEWTDGLGCDVCLLDWGSEDLRQYATRWTAPFGVEPESTLAAARWLDYYRRSEIASIRFGEIILRRRRGGPNWFRGFRIREHASGFVGAHLERMIAAQDFLTHAEPESLLDEVLVPAANHTLTHVLGYGEGEYAVDRIEVALVDGLGLRGQIEPLAVHVFMLLDGDSTLRELIDRAAAGLDIGRELLADATQRTMRRLLEEGFVVRAGRSA